MTSTATRLGRTIAWTSYNKPASITQGTRTMSFADDTEHQRFKQVTPKGTKLYLSAFGVSAEVTNPGTSSQIWPDHPRSCHHASSQISD